MKIFNVICFRDNSDDGRDNTNLRDPQLLNEVRNPALGIFDILTKKKEQRKVRKYRIYMDSDIVQKERYPGNYRKG